MNDNGRPLDAARGVVYALCIMLPVWLVVCGGLAAFKLFGGG